MAWPGTVPHFAVGCHAACPCHLQAHCTAHRVLHASCVACVIQKRMVSTHTAAQMMLCRHQISCSAKTWATHGLGSGASNTHFFCRCVSSSLTGPACALCTGPPARRFECPILQANHRVVSLKAVSATVMFSSDRDLKQWLSRSSVNGLACMLFLPWGAVQQ